VVVVLGWVIARTDAVMVTYNDIVIDTHHTSARQQHVPTCFTPPSTVSTSLYADPTNLPLYPTRVRLPPNCLLNLTTQHPISQTPHHHARTPTTQKSRYSIDPRYASCNTIVHSSRIRCLITPTYPRLIVTRRSWEGVTTERCREERNQERQRRQQSPCRIQC